MSYTILTFLPSWNRRIIYFERSESFHCNLIMTLLYFGMSLNGISTILSMRPIFMLLNVLKMSDLGIVISILGIHKAFVTMDILLIYVALNLVELSCIVILIYNGFILILSDKKTRSIFIRGGGVGSVHNIY